MQPPPTISLKSAVSGMGVLIALGSALVSITLWVPRYTQAAIDRHLHYDHRPFCERLTRIESKLDALTEAVHGIAITTEVLKTKYED